MRRPRRAIRILFHTGALLCVILATCSLAMWIECLWESQRWVWTATRVEPAAIPVTHTRVWEFEWAGGVMRLARTTVDSTPLASPVVPYGEGREYYCSSNGPAPAAINFPSSLLTTTHYYLNVARAQAARLSWHTPITSGQQIGLALPLPILLAVFLIWPLCWEFLYRRGLYLRASAAWRRRQHLCHACGYDLRHRPTHCPECGAPTDDPAATS